MYQNLIAADLHYVVHLYLQLQSPGVDLHYPGQLAQSQDLLVGQIADAHLDKSSSSSSSSITLFIPIMAVPDRVIDVTIGSSRLAI